MHKEIEKAVLRITQAMEKNRKAYLETERNYKDTGYDRYWNKMNKLEEEYEGKYVPRPIPYRGDYICPKCDTYNAVWKKRENTIRKDIVYCWHCGCKVQLN